MKLTEPVSRVKPLGLIGKILYITGEEIESCTNCKKDLKKGF